MYKCRCCGSPITTRYEVENYGYTSECSKCGSFAAYSQSITINDPIMYNPQEQEVIKYSTFTCFTDMINFINLNRITQDKIQTISIEKPFVLVYWG